MGTYYEARAKSSPYIDDDSRPAITCSRPGNTTGLTCCWDRPPSGSRITAESAKVSRFSKPFLAEAVPQVMTRELVGQLLGTLGLAYYRLGEVERAIGYYEQAPGDCPRDRRPPGRRERPRQPGPRLRRPGRGGAGHRLYEQSLGIDREIGDRRGEGNDLGNLGSAYAALGQAERAIGFYEQRLVIVARSGDRQGEGADLGNLGLAYASLGEAERAIGLLEQAFQIGQEIKDPQIIRIVSRSLERWRGGSGSE